MDMSITAFTKFVICIALQFSSVKCGCIPLGSPCIFTRNCCSGVCSLFFVCVDNTRGRTTTSIPSPVEELTTAPTTELQEHSSVSTTTESTDANCLRPGTKCTETNKCCLWTCQFYRQDEFNGENFGVCPIPMVPWPPFVDDAFPWNANEGSNSSPDNRNSPAQQDALSLLRENTAKLSTFSSDKQQKEKKTVKKLKIFVKDYQL
uniref:WAP domain-containing protein n=1 Tax=Graphocephala atropunctata TaxID=36148 RepID=A0A1B6LTY7_9HEMI